MTPEIAAIRNKIEGGKYVVSFSHTEKVRIRKIEAEDIEEAIHNGEIIEDYPEDPRGPSCLILGFTLRNRPLHVLCGKLEEDEILIITAYEPDPVEWEDGYRARRKEVQDA
jgi:hypothetical protein